MCQREEIVSEEEGYNDTGIFQKTLRHGMMLEDLRGSETRTGFSMSKLFTSANFGLTVDFLSCTNSPRNDQGFDWNLYLGH